MRIARYYRLRTCFENPSLATSCTGASVLAAQDGMGHQSRYNCSLLDWSVSSCIR